MVLSMAWCNSPSYPLTVEVLMDHGDDPSFLHMTGLSQDVFNMLLAVIFLPTYPKHSQQKGL